MMLLPKMHITVLVASVKYSGIILGGQFVKTTTHAVYKSSNNSGGNIILSNDGILIRYMLSRIHVAIGNNVLVNLLVE